VTHNEQVKSSAPAKKPALPGQRETMKKIPFTFYPVLLLLPFSPFSGTP
jgi:hypothetical protein